MSPACDGGCHVWSAADPGMWRSNAASVWAPSKPTPSRWARVKFALPSGLRRNRFEHALVITLEKRFDLDEPERRKRIGMGFITSTDPTPRRRPRGLFGCAGSLEFSAEMFNAVRSGLWCR